jgi:hypothetical protein
LGFSWNAGIGSNGREVYSDGNGVDSWPNGVQKLFHAQTSTASGMAGLNFLCIFLGWARISSSF